jgi:hypothetical protein
MMNILGNNLKRSHILKMEVKYKSINFLTEKIQGLL